MLLFSFFLLLLFILCLCLHVFFYVFCFCIPVGCSVSQNQYRSSISRLSGNDKSTLKKDKETVLDRNRVIKEEEDDIKIKDDSTVHQKVEIQLTPIEQQTSENSIGNIYFIKYSLLK